MTTITHQARELTETALHLDKISLHHTIEFRPEEACYFARRQYELSETVGTQTGYGLTAHQTRQLLRLIDNVIPRMNFGTLNGQPNPNDGRTCHTYRIGREYSRVIYVTVPHLYFREGNRLGIIRQIKASIQSLAEHYQADEFDIEDGKYSTTFRFWWD